MIAHHPRTKSLDGLRGIAILIVLCYHILNFGFLSPLFMYGWMGVDLFFVLSGFLITGILLSTKNHRHYYSTFLVRRVLRLWPLYYGVLIVFAFIAPHFMSTRWFVRYQWFYWTNTSNILLLLKGFFDPLGHLWSLAIEEQFYLLWPLVILWLRPRQVIWVSVALIILSICLRLFSGNAYISYEIPFAHADGLLMGSMIAIISRSRQSYVLARYARPFFFSASGLTLIFLLVEYLRADEITLNPYVFTVISIFFSSVLLMALHSKPVVALLSNNLLRFFGKYSYGMYVFFWIFFCFANWGGAARLSENQKLLVYVPVFLLTVLASYLSFNFFEVYFLRLKDKFTIPGTLEQ